MTPLDVAQLPAYLRSRGLLGASENCRIETLSGGVSNAVLRVEPEGRAAFVVKQSRERLQTEVPWFSRLDRIFRETAVMAAVRPLLPDRAIPKILDEDRENYVYAMEAVDAGHVVWKRELLAGRIREEVAVRLAEYLAAIHGGTAGNPAIADEFDDRGIFDELRVDPFYRHLARNHTELGPRISELIDEMWQTRSCLVHADFSPKNVLVVGGSSSGSFAESTTPGDQLQVTLIDFETGHYGDPAFDLGFFLSHLLLKGVRSGPDFSRFVRLVELFLDKYLTKIAPLSGKMGFEPADLERRTLAHVGACVLARIDGTSPVDYLTDPAHRIAARDFGSRLLRESVVHLSDATPLLQECLSSNAIARDVPIAEPAPTPVH
jgi:5-methylthioribose kinase